MKRARLADESALFDSGALPPPWPGRDHLVDGQRMFIRYTPGRTDAAEPALYVHGLGGSAQNWTDLAGVLSHRLDGQAVDLPGFGHSEPTQKYTIPALAQRVAAWITQSGRGPVHLFGNSLGGAISVYLAATRPHLVRTLTLISPAMPFANPRHSQQARLVPLLALPRVEKLAQRAIATITPEQMVDQVIDSCWADPGLVPAQRRMEAIDEVRRRKAVPWNSEVYVRTFRGLIGSFVQAYLPGSSSLWRLAAQITAPTLVIWGKQDKLVNVNLAPALAKAIDDSRLLILDRTGHVAMMERPKVVARAVTSLLDEIPSAPTTEVIATQ